MRPQLHDAGHPRRPGHKSLQCRSGPGASATLLPAAAGLGLSTGREIRRRLLRDIEIRLLAHWDIVDQGFDLLPDPDDLAIRFDCARRCHLGLAPDKPPKYLGYAYSLATRAICQIAHLRSGHR